MKGRVFEVAQADLQQDEVAHRKFKLISEDVQGKHVLTNFHGMSLTSDRLKSLVKKWQVMHTTPTIISLMKTLSSSSIVIACIIIYSHLMIRKFLLHVIMTSQTMIEATVDVKTTDSYLLRLFCIGFTKRQPNQIKKTSYAKASQVRNIRRRMVEIITREISQSDLKEVVSKL